jgi:hypothetical protein
MSMHKKLTASFIALSAVLLAVSNSQAQGDTIRVNSGASAPFVDAAGRTWAADSGFVGGQLHSDFNVTIAGTPDQALHQDERWDEVDFSYNFNVMTSGNYIVRLYEATLWDGACGVGTRIFDVTINGVKVLTDYDMSAEVGCLTAQIKTFGTVATNGQINITFNKGAVQNPKINAIEIYPGTHVSIMDRVGGSNANLLVSSSNNGISVQTKTQGAYTLELRTLRGESVGRKQGFGAGSQSFTNLRPGLYLLTSRVDNKTSTRTISVVR